MATIRKTIIEIEDEHEGAGWIIKLKNILTINGYISSRQTESGKIVCGDTADVKFIAVANPGY